MTIICAMCGRYIDGERHGVSECLLHLKNELTWHRKMLGRLCEAAAPISDDGSRLLDAGRGKEPNVDGGLIEVDAFVAVQVHTVMREIEFDAVREGNRTDSAKDGGR